MKTIRTIIIAALGALAACSPATTELEDYTGYVNVRIGSGGHGHVFVGASVPFGAVQLGPTSIPQQWDWCSGYHSSDSTVIGFSHTHLSGTGIGDLFDITVMPVVGTVRYSRGEEPKDASPEAIAAAQASGMWSYADRTKEIAKPGYYSVPLTRYGITAEMTATTRVGLSRYTFPASDSSAVVFDLENGGCWDRAYDTKFTVIDSCTIEGYRFSTGWAKDQKIYFRAQFSKPFDSIDEITAKEYPVEGKEYSVNYFRADFHTTEGEQVMLKVAVSPASEEKAALNMSIRIDSPDPEKIEGEIQTYGPNIALGYYKNEEATKDLFTEDGWLRTGDMGIIDKDGYLYIRGRYKCMFLGPNGQNIYPEELESVINSFAYVVDSLVIEDNGGLTALVYPDYHQGELDGMNRDDLEKTLTSQLPEINREIPNYAKIKKIEFMPEDFERTPKKSIKRYLYQRNK